MEIIQKIEEFDERENGGFRITTNNQIVELGINMLQDCCESFGYFMSEEDVNQYIGSELLGITVTDTALNTKQIEEIERGLDSGGIMFVNLETNRGTLQFVAYNRHNGYYGHTAYVKSNQVSDNTVL